MRHLLLPLFVAPLLVLASAAQAQTSASAQAEELFQQGRKDLEAGDCDAAEVKLSASLRIEPAVGTLISLAECDEAGGHLASARQHWQEAAGLADAKNDPLHRGAGARQHFAAIDARVPRIVVRLAPDAPRDTTFSCDGVALSVVTANVELPVDPGGHEITVEARRRAPRRYPLGLVEGQHALLQVEPGEVIEAPAPSPALPVAALPSPALLAAANESSVGARISLQRTAAYVVGGGGLVGAGVGAYFGLHALSEWSAAKSECLTSCGPGSQARKAGDAAGASADGATVAFSIAGAALAAGVVLWITSPARPPSASALRVSVGPILTRTHRALALVGEW
jgi:hypothetical protein